MSQITGQRPQELGFAAPAEPAVPSGMDRREVLTLAAVAAMPLAEGDEHQPVGGLQGIWRSEYQYSSSSRGGQTFTCNHYAVIVHRGERLRLRSLPKTADGQIAMELSLRDGQVVTGTWEERTDPSGYYKGAVYYGAIQMVVRPNGSRMSGSWVGFGREGEVNTGPWKLTLVTHETGREKLAEYNCPVVAKTPDGDDAEPVT